MNNNELNRNKLNLEELETVNGGNDETLLKIMEFLREKAKEIPINK